MLAELRMFQGSPIQYFCFFVCSEKRVNRGRHLYHSESRVKHLIDLEQFKEEDKKDIDVPFFNFEDILAATDNFLDANMLGRGGFGPVYKVIDLNFHVPLIFNWFFLSSMPMHILFGFQGKFLEEQEIGVKRLSRAS